MKRTNRPAFYDNLVDNAHQETETNLYTEAQAGENITKDIATFRETKFCTIELEKLEQYLQYIKSEMKKQQVRVQGVKFSFAKYVHNENDPKSNPLYQNRMTVIVGPVDLLSLAEGNLEGIENPIESEAMKQIARLNYMNITPPYGYTAPQDPQ